MKIAFLGNFGVPYSSESHYLKTFEKLGHQVYPLQEGKIDIDHILPRALKSDMFFFVHTHGWETPGIRKVFRQLKAKGIPSVGYHLDLWKGINREGDLQTDPYWDIEYFFTADKNFVPDLRARGIKAFYLPAGVFEDECYIHPTYNPNEFDTDIIFVGSRGYHPEWQWRPKLIDWLSETYGDRFKHYGGDGLGTVRGDDLNRIYARSKIAIGDTLCLNYDYPDYFSDRLFESTGRGAFTIFPYVSGLENFFKIGDEIETYRYGSTSDIAMKIEHYLTHNEERERIRHAGHLRTRFNHTYTHRLLELIGTLKKEGALK